jgi:hypothetical protein
MPGVYVRPLIVSFHLRYTAGDIPRHPNSALRHCLTQEVGLNLDFFWFGRRIIWTTCQQTQVALNCQLLSNSRHGHTCGTNMATFVAVLFRSKQSRYSPTVLHSNIPIPANVVVHSSSVGFPFHPAICSRMACICFRLLTGAYEIPSCPTTSVWRLVTSEIGQATYGTSLSDLSFMVWIREEV